MLEVNAIERERVSDRYIKHLITQNQYNYVDQKFYLRDYLWNIGVRCNINRDNYKIPSGLYAIGSPNENSEVLVTGNYKLTFDYLRRSLNGDYWILVIDTDGVNVWCAAGKGRFGTAEVIRMLKAVDIPTKHKRIILPQLSGPGIQSHLVEKHTGKKVIFGPIRIEDMDKFVQEGLKEGMRDVHFKMIDRMKLIPNELVSSFKILFLAFMISLLTTYWPVFYIFTAGSILGNVIFPLLLPYLPFKMFYKKGLLLSLLLLVFLDGILSLGLILLAGLYVSYLAMNFTGSTTFTSLTGVKIELTEAIPRMIKFASLAAIITIVGIFMEVL